MDWKTVLNIVCAVCAVIIYLFSEYYKKSATLREFIAQLIADAEKKYAEMEKAGAVKMAWVIEQLYSYVPAPLKPLFPKEKLEELVQFVFNQIAAYADIQVAKLKAKYEASKKTK